ncbi:MAG: type I DNA topoisomerase [Elusimicrobia bacterium]|nr:type I DNA topoisomerase [Elusimicrobiota bacterium]
MKKLVIVESPTKARTIKNFLGKEFEIVSSMGHIRDLPVSSFGVDLNKNFKPQYIIIPKKRKTVGLLKKKWKESDALYIATDGDREGEGIAWHIKTVLGVADDEIKRTVFHEITKEAVAESFKNPRKIDENLVKAYQARRILDRIVGYKISPLLWKNVSKGLSAGRVQSVALKMIVERTREIKNFKPEDYWKVEAYFSVENSEFKAQLVEAAGQKLKDGKIFSREIVDKAKSLDKNNFVISKIASTEKKISPPRPFTTSALQQQANLNFGFPARKTMMVAQQLYEGVDLPGGKRMGLITYMRTDSVAVAPSAQAKARKYIKEKFGSGFLPAKPPHYRTKAVHSQEAHEAIRPTNVDIEPESIKDSLSREQFLLYDLIWRDFLASQMVPAVSKNITLTLTADGFVFRSNRSFIEKDGFLVLFPGRLEENGKNKTEYGILSSLAENEKVDVTKIDETTHQTTPPPFFNDASLVKVLEEKGIGRPSTYASIIETLLRRKYIARDRRKLVAQKIGEVVTEVMDKFFPLITDYNFTSDIEEKLDKIAAAKIDDVEVLKQFYEKFSRLLERASKSLKPMKKVTDKKCPWCGSNLMEKMTPYGTLLYCSNWPACVWRMYITDRGEIKPEKVYCKNCNRQMILRMGRRGPFYACPNYPRCKYVVSFPAFPSADDGAKSVGDKKQSG